MKDINYRLMQNIRLGPPRSGRDPARPSRLEMICIRTCVAMLAVENEGVGAQGSRDTKIRLIKKHYLLATHHVPSDDFIESIYNDLYGRQGGK